MNTRFLAVSVLLFLAVASAVSLRDAQTEFLKFQRKYNKIYAHDEFYNRFEIFKRNLETAENLQKNDKTATFGVTKFMDLSPEEFRKFYLMPKNVTSKKVVSPPVKTDFSKKWTSEAFPGGPDPNNWDWFAQGVCTQVYNQGQCGSCWAFSATETIESYFALGGGSLTSLSMEQIVDCDTTDDGCGGGIPANAYQYVEGAGGLEPYSAYPYSAGNGQSGSCQDNQQQAVVTVSNYNSVSGEQGLYSQVSSAGPVSVCVDASSWQYYSGGVLSTCTNNIDHCVQLTGYGNAGGGLNGYWIVRNSWGADWGQSGFIWLQQGQDLCSIGDQATIVSATSA